MVDLEAGQLAGEESLEYRKMCDFPAIDPRRAAEATRDFWVLGISATEEPGRKFFDRVVRLGWRSGETDLWQAPRHHYLGGEPIFLDVLANATNTIAEGEVLQLMNCNNPNITESDYMEVVYRKTAKLFEAGTRIGAILAGHDEDLESALIAYGRHLGLAFQLVDDALDYDATTEELGKNIGDDLAEGKPTLPLIYAMDNGSAAERHMIREAIETGGTQNLTSIQLAIETSGGLRYTAERAREEATMAVQALEALPDSEFVAGLATLAQFAISRRF